MVVGRYVSLCIVIGAESRMTKMKSVLLLILLFTIHSATAYCLYLYSLSFQKTDCSGNGTDSSKLTEQAEGR